MVRGCLRESVPLGGAAERHWFVDGVAHSLDGSQIYAIVRSSFGRRGGRVHANLRVVARDLVVDL